MKIPLTHAAYLRELYAMQEQRHRKMIMAGRVITGCAITLAAIVAITYLSN